MTRWDRDVSERWGASVERTEPLERRDEALGNEPRGRLPGTLLVVGDTCWSCRAPVRAIVGVLVDPGLTEDRSGFLALADVDRILMAVVDAGALAERGIGALRHRRSPGVQGGYVSNGCPQCDALIGRFRVDDLLAEHRARSAARWPISRSTSPWTSSPTACGAGRRACGRTGRCPTRCARSTRAGWGGWNAPRGSPTTGASGGRSCAPRSGSRATPSRCRGPRPCAAHGSSCAPTSSGRRTPTTIPTARGAAWSASTALVAARHGETFDVAQAARLEVEWWRVHRDLQRARGRRRGRAGRRPRRALRPRLRGAAPATVRLAAQRAGARHAPLRPLGAGGLRPARARSCAQEREALVRSYAALLAAVHRG